MGETAKNKEAQPSSAENASQRPAEIVLRADEKSAIVGKFLSDFPDDLTDAQKTTKLQPFLTFKQAFGEPFFAAVLKDPSIPTYSVFEEIAKQLQELDEQQKKEISDALHNTDDFLTHMTQESATITAYLEAQKKETINLAAYPLGTSPEDKQWYANLLQTFHTTHTQKITGLLANTAFTPDVCANMSTGLLHRWIGKVDAHIASLPDENKPDKLDVSRLYATSPLSKEGEAITGKTNAALELFFTTLGKEIPQAKTQRDQYTQLMDPLEFAELFDTFGTTAKTGTATDGTAETTSPDVGLKINLDKQKILPAGKMYEFENKTQLQHSLNRVVTTMQGAKAPSEAKKMVESLTPMLASATEGIKGIVELLTSFFDELEKSGVLQQIKDLFKTRGEFTDALDPTKTLDAEKGEAQKTLAVEIAMTQIKASFVGMNYDEDTYKKTGGIREKLLTLDPSKLEMSLKESGISDTNFAEIFKGSEITNPLQLPEGSRIRQLMVKNMVHALGYDAAKKTQTDTALAASPDDTFKTIFTAYIDKKHADRTESAGRNFNATSDDTQTGLGGERFARAVLKSIFMDESKAKVDYTKKTVVEATEGGTETMYKLDAMSYRVDTNMKLHLDNLAGTTKVGVKVGDIVHTINAATPRETVDLRTQSDPVSVSFLQWNTTTQAWDTTNKLENVPIEMGIALKKTEGKYSLSGLNTTKTYETKMVYKKADKSGEETVSGSNIVTKDTYEIAPDPTKDTLDHVLLRPTTATPTRKSPPRQKIPLAPAPSA